MECITTPRARGVGWAKMRPARPLPADQTSVLDAVGVEIVAIISPVSICMFLCVVLVRLLRVDGDDATANIQGGIASAAYNEEAGDSTATKASGALLNSLVFVAFITCATFGIFFLFKHNCTKLIWGYLGFSGLLIFGVLGAVIGMEVLQKLNIALDMITFTLWVWNFSVVGVLVTFFWPAPLVMKQGYLITIGTIVAFYFTRIPEWTTWTLLVAMALYDVVAVLAPGGPLRVLVELAQERNEDIPALVYEARPVTRETRRGMGGGILESVMASASVGGIDQSKSTGGGSYGSLNVDMHGVGVGGGEHSPLMRENIVSGNESSGRAVNPDYPFSDERAFALPNAIKLGLGDFIFYSVLVGRAALYTLFTSIACYFAIIQGLMGTLLLLGFAKKTLPALPISIALGVVTYVACRFALEPVVQQMATRGLVF